MTGASAGTVSFIVSHKGVKSTTAAIERHQIDIQPIERVSEPDELGAQMLIEVQWDPDPKYYMVRYSPGFNSDLFVTEDIPEPSAEQIYPFDEDEDEWRYPTYPTFGYEDSIQVLTKTGFRNATVMDILDDDHSYICEYDTLLEGETNRDKQFRLDVWYQQARDGSGVEETSAFADSDDGEYSVPEEEDEEPPLYDMADSVEYQGGQFKVVNIVSDENGYNYSLKPKNGPTISVSESALEEQWIPRFGRNTEVVYNLKVALVVSIDYANHTYDIQLEENDAEISNVVETDLDNVPVLAYGIGTPVFYNFEFCTVEKASLTYTLRTSQGSEVGGITEDALHDWILFIDPKTKVQTIYHIKKRKEKSISRKGGKEKKLYYEVVDSTGKKKNIMASSPNIKEQEDAESFFEDASRKDGALEERIVFQMGTRVIIYGVDGDRSGVVVHHNETENVDDETYDINVDGHVSTFSVEEFGPVEESLSQPESEDEEFGVSQGQMEASSSSDSSSSDSEDEEESEFDVGQYVILGNSTTVYSITEAGSNVYTVESAWDDSDTPIEGVSASNLSPYEPRFEQNENVMHGDSVRIVREVHEDGMYVLDNGEEVTEDELQDYVEILVNGTIVRRVGSKDVYKVIGHQSCGNYRLKNVFSGEERLEVDQDVMVHEEPEFEKGDFVEMADGIARQVKAFKKSKWSYTLEGIDRPVSEAELSPATYEPEFDVGDEVVFEGEVYTIKKVVQSRKSYELNNGAEVKEEFLSSTGDE